MKLPPHNEIHELTQPCQRSCVPTSIAMAPLDEVMELTSTFSDLEDGMNNEEAKFLLNHYGFGTRDISNSGGGWLFPDGSYLINVGSLNYINKIHCVLLITWSEGEDHYASIFDHQRGNDKELYRYDDLYNSGNLSVFSAMQILDFSKYRYK